MYPQLAQRVFHTPLLAAPAKAAGFAAGLGPRILGTGQLDLAGVSVNAITEPSKKPLASILDDRVGQEIRSGDTKPFRVVDNIAVIPVTGTLIHRGAWVGSWSGETSYEGISAQIKAAIEHSSVRAIALEFDSHGGEVAGCFTLAEQIRKARDVKPIYAFVCDNAHSAAYAQASQATRVILPKTGSVGSIGVICMHADRSQQLEDAGVNLTIISAGDHKADANPYEPLPDDVRADLQQEMEGLRQIFAEEVEKGRGERLSAAAALATEAKCLLGQDAVDAGLADEVANPKEAFEAFAAEPTRRYSPLGATATQTGAPKMASKPKDDDKNTPAAETNDGQANDLQSANDKVHVSETGVYIASAPETPEPSASDVAATERSRIMGILTCDEATGREKLANSLAGDPNMSLEQAKKHLAAAPKEKLGADLNSQMEAQDNADLELPPQGAAPVNPVAAAHQRTFKDT